MELYNVGGRFVEICGDLFPACNIQVHETLEPVYREDHERWYGFYFEMTLENGRVLMVSQELASYLNEEVQIDRTPSREASTIEFWESLARCVESVRNKTAPDHAWYCTDLEALAAQLTQLMKLYSGTFQEWAVANTEIVQNRGTAA